MQIVICCSGVPRFDAVKYLILLQVYLDQKTCDLHYNGFCNSVLWQLFHYVPLNIGGQRFWSHHYASHQAWLSVAFRQYAWRLCLATFLRGVRNAKHLAPCQRVLQLLSAKPLTSRNPLQPPHADSKLSETRMLQFQWGAHQMANKIFADVVLQHYQDGDIVWVQVRQLCALVIKIVHILVQSRAFCRCCVSMPSVPWEQGRSGAAALPGRRHCVGACEALH